MTTKETQFLLEILRALERLYFRSEALEEVAGEIARPELDWKALVDRLAADPLFQPSVRDGFEQLISSFQRATSSDEDQTGEWLRLLGSLPVRGKPN
jgi:hypothetical protein